MKAFFRGSLATLVGSMALFVASTALADGEACYNDSDCPGTACGDAVCNWTKYAMPAVGMKAFACNPAGSQTPVNMDGWCTTDDDCKCKSLGAKCQAGNNIPHCTFTKPGDAPAGSGGSAAGGSSAGGSSAGGSTSAAGTTTSTAGTGPTASAGTGSTAAPASNTSSGCSVSAPIGGRGGAALALGVLGLGFALSRRRR